MKMRRSLWSRINPLRVDRPEELEELVKQLGPKDLVVKVDQKLGYFPEQRYIVKTKDGKVILDYFAPIGSRNIKINPEFLSSDASDDCSALLSKIKEQNLIPHFTISIQDLKGEEDMHELIIDMLYLAAENLESEEDLTEKHAHLNPRSNVWLRHRNNQLDYRANMCPRYFIESKEPGYVPDAAI